MLKYLPNFLSFLRIPLGCALFFTTGPSRFFVIFFAMLSDLLDGYLARRFKIQSKFGTLLDPLADKLFIGASLIVFFHEGLLTPFHIVALLMRDFAVILFGLILISQKALFLYPFKSIYTGKVFTALQFFTLFACFFKIPLPPSLFILFIVLGITAFFELLIPLFKKHTTY